MLEIERVAGRAPVRGPSTALRETSLVNPRKQLGRRLLGVSRAWLVGALVLLLGCTWTSVAAAAVEPVGFSEVPVASWRVNGPGYATLQVGDTIYVGGSFGTATSPDGAISVSRSNLAAFNATTGTLQGTFSADTDGPVRALAYDGVNLYVGGSFLMIGGLSRSRLAAVDPVTGAVRTAWKANTSSHVYALSIASGELYVGGSFSTIKNVARSKVAAIRLADAALLPFAPVVDGTVRALATPGDGSGVFVGGSFGTVNGQQQPYLAKLLRDASLVTLPWQKLGGPVLDLSLSSDGSGLGAAISGSGDGSNAGSYYISMTGQRLWRQYCDGDGQAVLVMGGSMFTGFHEGCAGDKRIRLTSNLISDGARDMSFRPSFDLFWGVWDIAGDPTGLVIAGEFTVISGVAVQGFAIFPRL